MSTRRLSIEFGISQISVWRVIKNDLELHPYKIVIEPLLSDDRKIKRKKFANWIRTYFQKKEDMRILFSDENFFDVDDVCNSQNDRGCG